MVTQSIKTHTLSSLISLKMSTNDIATKLDSLQKTIWDVDEKTIRNLESIAAQQLTISKIKSSLDLVKKELKRIKHDMISYKKK